MNLINSFRNYCKINNLEINLNQINLIKKLNIFYSTNFNKSLIKKIFSKQDNKPGFYLQGEVGVGKTMILNFFFDNLNHTKQRLHFNEFMISFHDFVFQNKENKKENIINKFVQKLKKKYQLIYFDEFQVTNIVDAMILNFFYENLNLRKQRIHFNEFMISFHDFKFKIKENKKENIIDKFVQKLKKNYELIYFDEFQVTNIVDAMILGNLFKKIFNENIKVLFSSNIKINDLYKDGLQRDQFLPFIKILKNKCFQEKLVIEEDYRKSQSDKNKRFLTKILKFYFPLILKLLIFIKMDCKEISLFHLLRLLKISVINTN